MHIRLRTAATRFLAPAWQRLCINDLLLALLLFCLFADLRRNWEPFHTCDQPVRSWLLGSYVLVAFLRAVRLVFGARACEEFDCLLPHGRIGNLTWPLLAVWTAVGTLWTWNGRARSKLCLGEQRHLFLVLSWIGASYT